MFLLNGFKIPLTTRSSKSGASKPSSTTCSSLASPQHAQWMQPSIYNINVETLIGLKSFGIEWLGFPVFAIKNTLNSRYFRYIGHFKTCLNIVVGLTFRLVQHRTILIVIIIFLLRTPLHPTQRWWRQERLLLQACHGKVLSPLL